MNKIAKVSLYIRFLIVLLACLNTFTVFRGTLFVDDSAPEMSTTPGIEATMTLSVDLPQLYHSFAQELENEGFEPLIIFALPELAFNLFFYFMLFKLFGLFQSGQIFTSNTVSYIRNIGIGIFIWGVFDFLYPILITLFVRITDMSDSLPLSIGIGSDQLIKFATGLIIFVIAWVMLEAQKLNQEQELTI